MLLVLSIKPLGDQSGASGGTVAPTHSNVQETPVTSNSQAQGPSSSQNAQSQRRNSTPPRNDEHEDDDGQSDRGSTRTQVRRTGTLDAKDTGRRRIKVDNIDLDDMPVPGHLRQWRVDMREKVTDAYAIDPDAALAWIKEIDTARSVEQLSSNKLPELEVQLAKAVKKCIKKNANFHAKISQLIEQGQQSGVRLTSRQIIYLMYEYLRPAARGQDMYDLQDLFAIKLGAHDRRCNCR